MEKKTSDVWNLYIVTAEVYLPSCILLGTGRNGKKQS